MYIKWRVHFQFTAVAKFPSSSCKFLLFQVSAMWRLFWTIIMRTLQSITSKMCFSPQCMLKKNWFMLLAVLLSSYGCTWKVWRALKKLELLCDISSGNSYASFVLSKLPACIHNSIYPWTNRSRSIYQYPNMAPSLSGQNCKFFKFL